MATPPGTGLPMNVEPANAVVDATKHICAAIAYDKKRVNLVLIIFVSVNLCNFAD